MNIALHGGASAITMTSREIADLVEARHNDVVATIERLFHKGLLRSSRKTRREDTGGRPIEVYDLIERDTHLVVSGYSDEHRARVIDRWQELESKPVTVELTRMEILKIAMDAEREKLVAIEQRDEAIRTKAQISDKKTATAMATASAKSKEVVRLKHELGRNQVHATVKAVKNATGIEYDWRALKAYCKGAGLESRKVADEQYGSVKAWPAMAWREVHKVDLEAVFPGGEQ